MTTGGFRIGASEVEAGVWAITLPAPSIYFRHSMAYLVATREGPVLIDTGEPSDESWAVLEAGVRQAGYAMADIKAVLLTHSHYDHCGAAARIKAVSNAWIGMSAGERRFIQDHASEGGTRALVREICLHAGGHADELPAAPPTDAFPAVEIVPDRILQDGERLDFGDVVLRVLLTPGHSPGHTAYLDTARGILFSGDHIFSQGSTVVLMIDAEKPDGSPADPFGDYLRSLARCDAEDIRLALPGHLAAIEDVGGRVFAERDRYERRLADTAAVLEEQPLPVAQLARRLRWGKGGWEDLPPGTRQLAIMNTLASLRALEMRGQATASDGGTLAYAIAGGDAA